MHHVNFGDRELGLGTNILGEQLGVLIGGGVGDSAV